MKEDKQQFNVYLTSGIIKQIKHRSIDEQLSLSDLVEKVFTAWLSQTAEDAHSETQPQVARENCSNLTANAPCRRYGESRRFL